MRTEETTDSEALVSSDRKRDERAEGRGDEGVERMMDHLHGDGKKERRTKKREEAPRKRCRARLQTCPIERQQQP